MQYNVPLPHMAAKGRLLATEMVHRAASGHLGGSLSAMDILALLYGEVLQIDVNNPRNPDRDRFVLSKGHVTPALYAILALRGFFPETELKLFRHIDGDLSGHPEMKHVPGVDMSTGSLGQGISAAVGMALAGQMDQKNYRVYALLGDGELGEGQVWEAAMAANKYKLNNLTAFVDVNGLQIDGPTEEVMPLEPMGDKFRAFGWHVIHADGHNFDSLRKAITEAKQHRDGPTMILAKTVKGKGISFMENVAGWHGKAPGDGEYATARAELEATLERLEA